MWAKTIKKSLSKYLLFLSVALVLTGCRNTMQKTNAEEFIVLLTNCKTYKTATTDSEFLEKNFREYFTQGGYQKFLEDKIHYIYPQLFYMEETKTSKMLRIQNTKCSKVGENKTLQYEIKYALEQGESTQLLEDQIQVTMNKDGKIEDFLVLNTSDVMHKLVIDMKIY